VHLKRPYSEKTYYIARGVDMLKGVKKLLEKDLAVASNIGKWLIIIALSGIGLYLLFWIVVMVLLAIYIGPKLETIVKRLRDNS
jgi:lipopolysaccharide/colanic/teichoic acid biosynthesis glycosyltransferase